jgi:hypothetical protein
MKKIVLSTLLLLVFSSVFAQNTRIQQPDWVAAILELLK